MAVEEVILKYKLDKSELDAKYADIIGKVDAVEKKHVDSAKKSGDAMEKAANQAATAFDSAGKKSANAFDGVEKKTVTVRTQIRQMTEQLLQLEASGQKGTKAYGDLLARLVQTKESVGNLSKAVETLKPEERAKSFQTLGKTMVGGFQAGAGALAVFTGSNEEMMKILLKTQAIIQGLEGVQAIVDANKQVRAFLNIGTLKAQAVATTELAVATEMETAATETATVATTGFKSALISTGIGALVVLLGVLIANFGKVTAWVGSVIDKFKILGQTVDTVRDVLHFISGGLIDDAATHKAAKAIDDLVDSLQKKQSAYAQDYAMQEQRIRQMKLEGASILDVKNKQDELTKKKLKDNDELTDSLSKKTELNDAEKKQLDELKIKHQELSNDLKENETTYTATVKEESDKREKLRQKEIDDEIAGIKEISDNQHKYDQQVAQDAKAKLDIQKDAQKEFDDTFKTSQQKELDAVDEKMQKYREAGVSEVEITKLASIEKTAINDKYADAEIAENDAKNKKIAENDEAARKKKLADDKAANEKRLANTEMFINAVSQLTHEFYDYEKAVEAEKASELEINHKKELDQLEEKKNKHLLGDQDYNKQKSAIDKKYDDQVKTAKLKAAKEDKALKLFDAGIAGALAIIKSLPNPALEALTVAMVAVQIGLIAAAPLPKFKRGTLSVPGNDTGNDSVMAMLRPGEAVTPTEQARKHRDAIKAIHEDRLEQYVYDKYLKGVLSESGISKSRSASFNDRNIVSELQTNNTLTRQLLKEMTKKNRKAPDMGKLL